MKFELCIEISKQSYSENWTINIYVHNSTIYDKLLFIENYPINTNTEDNKEYQFQSFNFNKLLFKKIQSLLLPKATHNYVSVTKDQAWDYWHYCTYEGFTFNVHPVSISQDFFRFKFKGTQEELLEKAKIMNKNWTNKLKSL